MLFASRLLTVSLFQPLLISIAALIIGISLSTAYAADPEKAEGWTEKYDEAMAAAKKTGRPILADFTGSDWCGWCIKLHKEVFDTKEFKEWAAANAVLYEIDFPRKTAQDAAIKAKNAELVKKYQIEGYPTILILDAEGKKLGELGYMAGGPKVFIAEFVRQYKENTKK
jgi:thioredoxin-related protein